MVATSSESENVFITLAARELNPVIRIHARAESESGIRRLRRAGADRVEPGSAIADCAVRELEAEATALRIVALKRHDAAIQLVPDPSDRVEVGDHLVDIGARPQLNELAQRAQGQ